MTGLAGKVAVVTGGSSGIGRAIALGFARAGAHVVVASRNQGARPGDYGEGSEQPIVDFIRSEGHQAVYLATDVTRAADVDALAGHAMQTFGALDIWINNAGVMPPLRGFCDYAEDELDLLLSTNTKGVWHGIRAAARQMLAGGKGGAIVNVLSTAAIRPHAHQSIYDISKAAAAQATRCAALELGTAGIRVNAVCPTVTKTPATRAFVESDQFRQWFKTVTTLGMAVDAQQVADAVMFLASDAASTTTGIMFPIDSGEALGPPASDLPGGSVA